MNVPMYIVPAFSVLFPYTGYPPYWPILITEFKVVSLSSSPPSPLQLSQHIPYHPLRLYFLCVTGIFIGLPKVANGKDRDGIGPNETKDKKCGPLLRQNPSTGYLYIFSLLFIQIVDLLLNKIYC